MSPNFYCSQQLRPDTCPLLQDERVNTVHQKPKFQPMRYIPDVTDGMIEHCGRYNVIVGDGFSVPQHDISATNTVIEERTLCSMSVWIQCERNPNLYREFHQRNVWLRIQTTTLRCLMRKMVFHTPRRWF